MGGLKDLKALLGECAWTRCCSIDPEAARLDARGRAVDECKGEAECERRCDL